MNNRLFIGSFVSGVIALVSALVWMLVEEERQWEEFKIVHECKKVGYIKPGVSTGVVSGVIVNGQPTTMVSTIVVPGKTGWLCNDNVTYWR